MGGKKYLVEAICPWGEDVPGYKHILINQWDGAVIEISQELSVEVVKKDYKGIETLGVYFLLKRIEIPNNPNAYKAYVGITSNLHDRVIAHNKQKIWWDEIIFFRTFRMNDGHLAVVENTCWGKIKRNDNIIVDNKNEPSCTTPQTKRDEIIIDLFTDEVITYLEWKNINILEQVIIKDEKIKEVKQIKKNVKLNKNKKKKNLKNKSIIKPKISECNKIPNFKVKIPKEIKPHFFDSIKLIEDILSHKNIHGEIFEAYNRGCRVTGYPTEYGGFMVLAGSYYSEFASNSFKTRGDGYSKRRDMLKNRTVIEQEIPTGEIKRVLTKDYYFESPTSALERFSGNSSNPGQEFMNEERITLSEFINV